MVRRRFRHWAALGLVPTSSLTGQGVGTRRTYSTEALLLGAILAIIARRGLEGSGVCDLASALDKKLQREGFMKLWRDGGYLVLGLDADGRSVPAFLTHEPAKVIFEGSLDCWMVVDVGQLATRLRKVLQGMA